MVGESLSTEGSLSGKLTDTRSTRESLDAGTAAQAVPSAFDTADTCVRFFDLAGQVLLDAQGNPIPEVPIGPDGSFQADNLPVGVDFTICGDIGKDGTCELESCINIPADETGEAGFLDGAQADPLTKLILGKLRQIIDRRGVDLRELPFSPATVVTRIVNAYVNLFEDAGIDQGITLEDVAALAPDQLAALFDSILPPLARTGMEIAESNLKIVRAGDAEQVALGAAEVLLRAGFPVMDTPEPPDLGALAELDGITTTTRSELFGGPEFNFEDLPLDPGALPEGLPEDLEGLLTGEFPDGLPEDLIGALPDDLVSSIPPELLEDPQQLPDFGVIQDDGTTIYISDTVEPDRNFTGIGEDEEGEAPRLPILTDRILLQMARLQLEGRRITLAALHDLLTSIDGGLGARLTYFVADPNFFGPPLTVFETADGKGKAIRMETIFQRLAGEDLAATTPDDFDRHEEQIRTVLRDLLADTVAPAFERLFDSIIMDRVAGTEAMTRRIREARAHLPFNRSGPKSFFVVASADPFRNPDATPVTVDVAFDGLTVTSVVYNSAGTGRFYLGFTQGTEERGTVELIVRETGRFLHGNRGPLRLSMSDESTFAPIEGQPFYEFVSESGIFFPGVGVNVIRHDFAPPSPPPPTAPNDDFVDGGEPIDGGGMTDAASDGPTDEGSDDPFLSDPTGGELEGQPDEPAEEGDPAEQDPETEPAASTVERDLGNEGDWVFVLATRPDGGEPVRVDYDRTTGIATYNPAGRNLLMFLPDSHETGIFALFNESAGRPASLNDPGDFLIAPPELPEGFDGFFNGEEVPDNLDGFENVDDLVDEIFGDPEFEETPPVTGGEDAPLDETPAEEEPTGQAVPDEGTLSGDAPPAPSGEPIVPADFILVSAANVVGLPVAPREFTHVFGIEAPNERYNPDGDPYFDDINGNGLQDEGEPTAPHRPVLFDPRDWRATDIRLYYRRADNHGAVTFEDVAFDLPTPQTRDGVALVPRTYLPRRNAFRFGRANTAINLITAFTPPDFFNGTRGLNRETTVDIFSAIALINLVMDQVLNVEAEIDVDGIGPQPRRRMLAEAFIFVAPLDDPFLLLVRGFRERSQPAPSQ